MGNLSKECNRRGKGPWPPIPRSSTALSPTVKAGTLTGQERPPLKSTNVALVNAAAPFPSPFRGILSEPVLAAHSHEAIERMVFGFCSACCRLRSLRRTAHSSKVSSNLL